jgi:hypothetical protein
MITSLSRDLAIFSFCIIFATLTLLQVTQVLNAMPKRHAEEDFLQRLPFIILTFFAIFSLIPMFSLYAILVSLSNLNVDFPAVNLMVVSVMLRFVHELLHVFLYAALLLLNYCSNIQTLQYGHSRSTSKSFVITVRCTSSILLLIMFVCTLAHAIIRLTVTFILLWPATTPCSMSI